LDRGFYLSRTGHGAKESHYVVRDAASSNPYKSGGYGNAATAAARVRGVGQRSNWRGEMPKSGCFWPFLVDFWQDVRYTRECIPGTKPVLPPPTCYGGNVTFQVGDKVIYPNHGLGIVERVEEKTILGTTCGFFHLRIVSNDTTVLVPVANVDGVGLRKAITDEEVERLFTLLGDGRIDNHQNWKGRFKDNSDKMRTGSIYDMADVLKSLTFLSKSKSLSFREKRMLDRAKALIISEVSEVVREKALEVEQKVDSALEKCFMVKARNVARATARAKVSKPVKASVMAVAAPRRVARAS
jgi:CarD family transcriptional regulator, regulator of rRNA transcription